MLVVTGTVQIVDVDALLQRLRTVGEAHGSLIQAVDARYVAGDEHLGRAVELTRRAIEVEDTIAEDPAMELLLYIAGTRQIDRALEIGIRGDEHPVAIVIDGGDEEAAVAAIRESLPIDEVAGGCDEDRIADWFGITNAERAATTATLEALVTERVALLALDS